MPRGGSWHDHGVTRHQLSDVLRTNICYVLGTLFGVAVGAFSYWAGEETGLEDAVLHGYATSWISYTVIYLGWTHRVLTRRSTAEIAGYMRAEKRAGKRPWIQYFDYGGAAQWTITGSVMALFVTIYIAQDPVHRSDPLMIMLGVFTVASSWAVMVYAFAQEYLRLVLTGDRGEHMRPSVPRDVRFEDFLTLAVLTSTMAATISADIRSREAWRIVRTNVLLAFVFNTVIVAMVVSFLFSGILN